MPTNSRRRARSARLRPSPGGESPGRLQSSSRREVTANLRYKSRAPFYHPALRKEMKLTSVTFRRKNIWFAWH